MNSVGIESLDHFNIRMKIIEAKDLPNNVSSLVQIQFGKETKKTKVIKRTNQPYFNEYFVFEVNTNFQSLMSTIVVISIYHKREKIKIKKLIGCIIFDIGMIWFQTDQRLQDWLPLTIPSDDSGQVKGMLKCDIRIETPLKYRRLRALEETINSCMTPVSPIGKRVRYKVKIYKYVGLVFEKREHEPDVFFSVSYAGKTGHTTKRKLRDIMEWNEQINFTAMFPPLFHKITIDLVVGVQAILSKHLYILEILQFCGPSTQKIFGPSYVHMYKDEFSYSGSVLMAIEIDSSGIGVQTEKNKVMMTLPAEHPNPQSCGYVDSFLCFGLLFDAMLCNRNWKGSNIQLTMNFGFTKQNSKTDRKDSVYTDLFTAAAGNSDFSYLPLSGRKPCVFVRSDWPDCTHRLFNSNMLSSVTQSMRKTINNVEDLISRGNSLEAINIIKNLSSDFKKCCKEVSQKLDKGVNQLDFERAKFLTKMLKTQLPELANICMEETDPESVLQELTHILNVADELCKDKQESLPCVVLSLRTQEKVIGSVKVNPRHILFSKNVRKRGRDCGKIISVMLKSASNKLEGRLDIWLWLGFWDEVSYCLKELPPGHEDLTKIVNLPSVITYGNFESYVIYCQIYRGYIIDSSRYDSKNDTFVRVICQDQSQQTRAKKQSITPMWEETLVLSGIKLYPSQRFCEENPPFVTVELWNKAVDPKYLIGVELIRPSYSNQIQQGQQKELRWLKIGDKAQILSAFDIFQMNEEFGGLFNPSALLKADLKLSNTETMSFRIEVVFWGIRPIDVAGKKRKISQVQIKLQCSNCQLISNINTQNKKTFNFHHNLQMGIVALPFVKYFSPPLILDILSDNTVVGRAIERNINRYVYNLPTKKEWESLQTTRTSQIDRAESQNFSDSSHDTTYLLDINPKRRSSSINNVSLFASVMKKIISLIDPLFFRAVKRVRETTPILLKRQTDDEENNWWSVYFSGNIIVYNNELENQKEFNGFSDALKTFTVKEQKSAKVIEVVKVKMLMCLYKWPSDRILVSFDGQDPEIGVLRFENLKEHVNLLVRVYCVKAYDLHPTGPNGLADPFIEISTPSNCVSDKSNYIANQLNPIFGKCLDIPAVLPTDSILMVRVMDRNVFSAHEIIGETCIDIENRYYSKHRASCGLPKTYTEEGFNNWRDVEKPCEILEKLCSTNNIPPPKYFNKSVLIGSKEFYYDRSLKNKDDVNEKLALMVLNRWSEVPIVGWPLVPQHVETRSLFVKDKPGLERGKLELWIDFFDRSLGEIPPPIDIKPQEPQLYELRVVILNTAKVPLVEDSFFVGRRHTDIFVKGWLWNANESQATDVHYISTNGTGNFNWRFIFQFAYLKNERRMVIREKEFLSFGETEKKVPALLHLQVWDSDRLSSDDFIGAMVLELCNMPRGALSVRTCKPRQYLASSKNDSSFVNLFKVKRLKGWWPFFQMTDDIVPVSAGFLEAEFHLLTKDEALFNPAGLGRSAPHALPPPIRPSITIKFWLAPLRAIFYYVCGVHKEKALICLFATALMFFVLVGMYSVPIFLVKRLLGA